MGTSEQQPTGVQPSGHDIKIERADLASRSDVLLELLAEYLAEQVDARDAGRLAQDRWRWMYRGNPHGEAITYLARERASGAPAGMISLFPRRVATPAGEWLGGMGGDSYVRPAFRRRGIARALHRVALDEMGSGRIPVRFMFTAPNARAAATVGQAGGVLVGAVRRFVRPPLPWIGWGQRLAVEPLGERADPRVDELMNALAADVRGQVRVLPQRDAAHWAWRYGASPARRQRAALFLRASLPVGLAAWECLPDRLAIIDLWARGRDYPACLRALFELARQQAGSRRLEMRLHTGAPYQGRLRAAGFLARESTPFLVQCSPGLLARRELVREPGWWFTTGDVDIDALGR